MIPLQITVRNKEFVHHNGVNVEKFTPNYVEGNGWTCEIDSFGNITCIATRIYFGVSRQLRFTIKKGYVKIKLKIDDAPATVLKSYKLNQWPTDGVLRLSDGYIDKRRAYFRESSFQNFLEEHGITTVRYETPDGVYKLIQKVQNGTTISEEKVETDGQYELTYNDIKYPEESNIDTFTVYRLVEITGASWAIKTSERLGVAERRVLYTTEDPQKLVGLPKLN